MDVRSLSASQLHALDVATNGSFLAVLHRRMIAGPYTDADVTVDFEGRGFRVVVVLGARCDGHEGKMVTFVVGEAHALPEQTRVGLVLLQVECFQAEVQERQRRADTLLERAMARRVARYREK